VSAGLGVGFGLIYLPAIVSVGFYFEHKRSFAMGIAVCGSGLGTLIFPWLMPYVINAPLWFDYDGGLLLEAGMVFVCVIFGVLMVIDLSGRVRPHELLFAFLDRFRYLKSPANVVVSRKNLELKLNKRARQRPIFRLLMSMSRRIDCCSAQKGLSTRSLIGSEVNTTWTRSSLLETCH
jgi:MFS family permease